ncbi:MAG: DUF1292 domain-containing protein [Lachnospiraceae bacterium]
MSTLDNNEQVPQSTACDPTDCASCGSNCDSSQDTPGMITLTMDDGTDVNCAILTIFPVNEKEYIALLPLDENGENEDGAVYLYAFSTDANENPILDNIDSDDEYLAVSDAFDVIVQNAQAAEEAGEPL